MSRPPARRQTTSLAEFLDAVAAAKPTPAGGSVAALVGALAASLGVMGARFGHRSKTEKRLVQLSRRLHRLVQDDTEAYDRLSKARKVPKEKLGWSKPISVAVHKATEIPLNIAELSCEAGWLIHSCLQSAKPAVHSDLTVGMMMAIVAAEAGCHTVGVNLKEQPNQRLKKALLPRIAQATRSLEELKGLWYTPPPLR